MSTEVDFQLQGFDEIERQFSALELAVGLKVLRQSCGIAMTPVVREARGRAPVGDRPHNTYKGRLVAPGFLSRSIKKRTYKRKTGEVGAVVGVLKEAHYGVNFLPKGMYGKHRGPKNEFLVEAFDAQKHTVLNRLKRDLLARVEKAANKK